MYIDLNVRKIKEYTIQIGEDEFRAIIAALGSAPVAPGVTASPYYRLFTDMKKFRDEEDD